MIKSFLAAPVAAAALALCTSGAPAAVLVPIPPVPGSIATFVATINNHNQIAGDYITPDDKYHGFVGTPDGQYITFDAPKGGTFVERLSDDGYITGLSNIPTHDCPIFGCQFLRTPEGMIENIRMGHARLDGLPAAILPHGRFVGQYTFVDQYERLLFLGYYGKKNKYQSDLTLPFNTDRTSPRGYNSAGAVAGYFHDLDAGDYAGFILQNGTAAAIRYPDDSASRTFLEAINRKGLVAGYWVDEDVTFSKGFLYDGASGKFLPLAVDGALFVTVGDINNAGLVTLVADNSSYLYCPRKKTCPISAHAIDVPDRWIAARGNTTRVCLHRCAGPISRSASGKPPA